MKEITPIQASNSTSGAIPRTESFLVHHKQNLKMMKIRIKKGVPRNNFELGQFLGRGAKTDRCSTGISPNLTDLRAHINGLHTREIVPGSK